MMGPIENIEEKKKKSLNALIAEMITKHARFPIELIGICNNEKKVLLLFLQLYIGYSYISYIPLNILTFFEWNGCPKKSKTTTTTTAEWKRKTFQFENVFSFGHWKPLIWSLMRMFICVLFKLKYRHRCTMLEKLIGLWSRIKIHSKFGNARKYLNRTPNYQIE